VSEVAGVDVIVVGAGIVGCAAAYHLAERGVGVRVFDRYDAPGRGSTGACAGGFRHQFSSEVNIRLSQASTPMITGFAEEHGIPLDVSQDGYLFLVRDEPTWEGFRSAADFQRRLGVPVDLLDAREASELVPGIANDDVVGATFCSLDGIADPAGLTQGYARLAARAGASLELGVDVTALERAGDAVVGVRTATEVVRADAVVLATGAWTAPVAATAGIDVPIEPVPRTIVTTASFAGVPARRTLVIDAATSFYFHREADGVLMGMAGDDRPGFDTAVDEAWLANELVPRAVEVFPPVGDAGIRSSWAGLYEMTPDRHPVIDGACPGLWIAAGFSGHGFQHGPVTGKLLAEMITEGKAHTVDVSALALDRFASGSPVRETRVV
jgi:sarcosine oxidase subunit beta